MTAWLMSSMSRPRQFIFHDMKKKEFAEGYFNDKIPAAICWCNEMAGDGRRSG